MKTLQEIYNQTLAHLQEQGEWAISAEGSCRYRAPMPGGRVLKCAVGVHIADAVYSSALEGADVNFPCVIAALEASGVEASDPESHELLYELQYAHDTKSNWDSLRDETAKLPLALANAFRRIAESFGLDPII